LAACEAAGIPTTRKKGICFHDLRHFAAYRLLKHTDVITVMRIMGWKSLSMVERYIHPTDEGKRLAVEAASADLFPVQGRQNYVNAQDGQHEEQPAELAEIKRVQ
jgi:integrase